MRSTFLRSLLPSLNNLKHFLLSDTSNLWQWHRKLGCFFVSLVFYLTRISECTSRIRAVFDVLALLKAFAFVGFDLSRRYCGRGVLEGSVGAEDLTFRSSCALICFFIWIFSWCLFFWYNFARRPVSFWASSEALCPSLAALFRVLSSWSSLLPWSFLHRSMLLLN
jgi:hypothetical protein